MAAIIWEWGFKLRRLQYSKSLRDKKNMSLIMGIIIMKKKLNNNTPKMYKDWVDKIKNIIKDHWTIPNHKNPQNKSHSYNHLKYKEWTLCHSA